MSVVKTREALLGVAVGKKGVGKTYATLELIQDYLRGNPATGAKPRKVLILDTNNEFCNVQQDVNPRFSHIKAIRLEDIRKFTFHPKIEARRVSILKEGGGKMTLNEIADALEYILLNYQNGLLLIEDINKFVNDSLPSDLVGAIVTQRHMSVDIITHFQSIGRAANPKIWANVNWLRFHKCEDTVERHKTKFAGDVTHLHLIEKMVDMEHDKGNIHFYAYLNKDNGKIMGKFTLQQFQDAIEAYLQENDKIINKEANRKDVFSGQKIHKSYAAAAQFLIAKYVKDYYGNPK
jgi:hypothetical protein